MYRRRENRRKGRKIFSRTAGASQSLNRRRANPMRGGFRL